MAHRPTVTLTQRQLAPAWALAAFARHRPDAAVEAAPSLATAGAPRPLLAGILVTPGDGASR